MLYFGSHKLGRNGIREADFCVDSAGRQSLFRELCGVSNPGFAIIRRLFRSNAEVVRNRSREEILKKSSLWISASAAILVAVLLAGCGKTTYFAGRNLPPSKLQNRVLIAVQNSSAFVKGELQFVDAYYDIRSGYRGQPANFSISGYGGSLPITIQNMPEEQTGIIYGSGDGSFTPVDYSGEKTTTAVSGLNGLSSSIYMTRNGHYVVAANEQSHVVTIVAVGGGSIPLNLPGVYRVSVNPGGTMALAFVRNSNYAYYPRELTSAQSITYSGGPSAWPKAAVDCEPQNNPQWCLFQVQSPDQLDATGNYTGAPIAFDRPVKAVFSVDGGTAYVLSCGAECGGTNSGVSVLPVSPLIFQLGQNSGLLPCNTAPCTNPNTKPMTTIPVPGGATNAIINNQTMYVVGQRLMTDGYYGGFLTQLNLANNTVVAGTSGAPNPASISDGIPGGPSRMVFGDDNTLWIGMTKCNQGERFYNNQPFGCMTMYDTSKSKVVLLEPYLGDATGIAAVTGLHKVYSAQGGQVYIHSTTNGTAIDNQYVTVTGTAADVAYMDAISDSNNTVY